MMAACRSEAYTGKSGARRGAGVEGTSMTTVTPPNYTLPPNYVPPSSSVDADHLQLLTVFHYVLAGLTALFGCFPCIHLALGIAFLSGAFPPDQHGNGPPRFIGVFFIAIALFLIAWFWALAVLIFLGAQNLRQRRRYTFCFVVAAIECLFMPFGTVLGIFTIIVLMRPTVKQLFGSIPGSPAVTGMAV
jgi:hypothetical protein